MSDTQILFMETDADFEVHSPEMNEKKGRLQEIFRSLAAEREALGSLSSLWLEIEDLFKQRELRLQEQEKSLTQSRKDFEEAMETKEGRLLERESAVSKIEMSAAREAELEARAASLEAKAKEYEAAHAEKERLVKEKEESLAARVEEMNAAEKARILSLDEREKDIVKKESAAAKRVQELKESALAAVAEEKRKWEEMKVEAHVVAVQNSLGRVTSVAGDLHEELLVSDEAVKTTADEPVTEGTEDLLGSHLAVEVPGALDDGRAADDVKDEYSEQEDRVETLLPSVVVETTNLALKNTLKEAEPRPELITFCTAMDAQGLMNFILNNRKDGYTIRCELPGALKQSLDPFILVLNALDSNPDRTMAPKPPFPQGAKRRASISLLESLSLLMAKSNHEDSFALTVPASVKAVAKNMADRWISLLDPSSRAANDQDLAVEAHALLQLIVTFNISSQFSADQLASFVSLMAKNKSSIMICKLLGLGDKMQVVIDRLVKDSKQIEAIRFAREFNILDEVDAVTLLKTFLRNAKKTAAITLKDGKHSSSAVNDAMLKEASSIRAAIRCIEECSLEEQFPTAPLTAELGKIEQAKAERKKRSAEAARAALAKRRRPNVPPPSNAPLADRSRYVHQRLDTRGPGMMPPRNSPQGGYNPARNPPSQQQQQQQTSFFSRREMGPTQYRDNRPPPRGGGSVYSREDGGNAGVPLPGNYVYSVDPAKPTVMYASHIVDHSRQSFPSPPKPVYNSSSSGYTPGAGMPRHPPSYHSPYKH